MNHEEQISRMQSEGLIDDRQAELLRSAFQGAASDPPDKPSRFSRWLLTILITIILALVAALAFSSGSDPETLQNISQTLNQPGSTGNLSVSLSIILRGTCKTK